MKPPNQDLDALRKRVDDIESVIEKLRGALQ